MKLLSFILALALAQGALSACNANNCARAVTGTRIGKIPDQTSRMRDCSSFMLVTVTPATSTITATATITSTTTLGGMMKRQAAVLEQRQVTVTPSSIPIYASACSSAARYSSACSCWGITARTTTASAPVTRTTVTVTATASVCPVGNTKCGTSCLNLQVDPKNCGACGNACAFGTTCQSGACASAPPPGNCPTYTASCSSVMNGILATDSIASPQLVDYRFQTVLLGITNPSDFLAGLGPTPCQTYTDPTEYNTCVELLANPDFVSKLTNIVLEVLTAFQTCASNFAAGVPDYQVIINGPANETCGAPNSLRRHVNRVGDGYDLSRSMLEAIEYDKMTAPAPVLGRMKPSSDLIQLVRRQQNNCARTGTCFETCPACRDQQLYCGSTASPLTVNLCRAGAILVGAAVRAAAGTAAGTLCGTACLPAGPIAAGCAVFCATAAAGFAGLAVNSFCPTSNPSICTPLSQQCTTCNLANNGLCDAASTQCCVGETGTQCGANCCCCPQCQAPSGINCACAAAPC
ncbi:hypothetical protein IFR04_008552 [Cadophora malorum]|uniref:Uncharacterized protein n=1 Tax=Cadophora malorum TaxID=108018 RepID=A0A8H7TF16_9HELO|nr:hypothetical protein IFR04_008552 [Cadophora malorum]